MFDYYAADPCACGMNKADPDGYCHWCRGAELREEPYRREEPAGCKHCGASWQEVKCYPPDGVGVCSVCNRSTEE